MKVLIADDSTFMRTILKNIVAKAGIENLIVVEAENGEVALSKYVSELPDLMLLDIVMPKKSGLDVLRELKDRSKVIIISAIGQDDTINEAKALGVSEFITKPFDFNKVVETLQKVIHK